MYIYKKNKTQFWNAHWTDWCTVHTHDMKQSSYKILTAIPTLQRDFVGGLYVRCQFMEKSEVCEPSALNKQVCFGGKKNRRWWGNRTRSRSHCAGASANSVCCCGGKHTERPKSQRWRSETPAMKDSLSRFYCLPHSPLLSPPSFCSYPSFSLLLLFLSLILLFVCHMWTGLMPLIHILSVFLL